MAAEKRSWKKVAMIGLIYTLGFLVLVKEDWLVGQMTREQSLARAAMGAERTDVVIARANNWFQTAFIDSGIQANSFRLLVPSEGDKKADPKPEVSEGLWTFVEERVRVLWTIVFQALQRFSMALVWVPTAVVLLFAFAVDGLVSRKIKATNFDYTSPVRHRYSLLAIDAAIGLFLLALFAPIAIAPLALPTLLMLIAFAMSVVLANMQKKI